MRQTIKTKVSISKTQYEDHKSILRFIHDSHTHSHYFISIGGICTVRLGPYLLASYVVNSKRGVKWVGSDGRTVRAFKGNASGKHGDMAR